MSPAVIPLESNPQLFTQFAQKLGLSPLVEFNDIYSLTDPDLLAFLPRPVYSIIILFPITENYEKNEAQFVENQIVNASPDNGNKKLFDGESTKDILWFKQIIKNACGMYALLHSLGNGTISQKFIADGSTLSNILQKANNTGIQERSKLVLDLQEEHNKIAQQGETEAPNAEDDLSLHFMTFTKNTENSHLYELDGRKPGPVDLGKASSSSDDIIEEKVILDRIQQLIKLSSDDTNNNLLFSAMALTPALS